MEIRIRKNEGCAKQPFLLWDSVWDTVGGYADWQLAGDDEHDNQGGLKSDAALHTAVLLCLFTDKRASKDQVYEGEDLRGWWGDTIDIRADLFEREMGSLLWTLERSPLNEQTEIAARDMTYEALNVLIEQGAVVLIKIETSTNIVEGRLEIGVMLYSHDETSVYDERFGLVWDQIDRLAA